MNRNNRYRIRLRAKAIARMGGRCVHCGFDDTRALVFDHVKPMRRGLNGKHKSAQTGDKTHRVVLKGSKAYQLLCANCHAIKTRQDDSDGRMSVNWSRNPMLLHRLKSGLVVVDDEDTSQLELWDDQTWKN
jgi:5-methylcytosine-specific restriction endonuclease McrA